MVTTSGVGSAGGTTGVDTPSTLTGLSNNYELFLSMLTTQIQNQDPLDPTDSSKYTEQLVQYSSVEQQIRTNDQLSDLLQVMASSTASSYVSYLGTNVVASGNTTELKSGEASWTYDAGEGGKARVDFSGAVEKSALGALGQERLGQTMDVASGGWRVGVYPMQTSVVQEFVMRNTNRPVGGGDDS